MVESVICNKRFATNYCETDRAAEPISSLFEQNSRVVTGYEGFCLRNGDQTRYPFKDFDFVGKKVVCHGCYQKFASRWSYRAHIGTDVCAKPTAAVRNPVYLAYKRENGRRKGKTSAVLGDMHLFQTRQKSYDNGVQTRGFHGRGERSSCNAAYRELVQKKPPAKKPPAAASNGDDGAAEPRKRGRPRKMPPTDR